MSIVKEVTDSVLGKNPISKVLSDMTYEGAEISKRTHNTERIVPGRFLKGIVR